MAPLDQAMTNVIKGPRRGYRFLPHMTFGGNLRITVPYDPALIPAGLSAHDVRTVYYDKRLAKWEELPLVSVNQAAATVTSNTNHFTDFIDATITVPDHPGTQSLDPTSIKNIKAADPGANINLIAPSAASSDGSAHLSYPIALPARRHRQAASLPLTPNYTHINGRSRPAARCIYPDRDAPVL